MVDVNEYQVNVFTAGSGPCLLMVHGEERGEQKKGGWRDWEKLLPNLANDHRVVAPDLIGFGKSHRIGEPADYITQARMLHDLLDVMKIERATVAGYSWGGQIAIEFAINWPQRVENLVLVASTYDKPQLPKLASLGKPSLIVWAEDDLNTQLKAGYLLRDAIRTSRLEVLPPVAKDPRHDFTYAHRLLTSRPDAVLGLIRAFLASPRDATAEPPPMESELRGLLLKGQEKEGAAKS
jgi:pimeloyl-ACP methyl ester carboxylesterase